MDPEVLTEAKDFVTAWIDKSGADGNGVNMEVSSHKLLNFNLCVCNVDGLQGHQGLNGPPIWSLLACDHGRGFLFRSDPLGQVHPLHVLRRQDRHSPLQVLSACRLINERALLEHWWVQFVLIWWRLVLYSQITKFKN